MKRNSFVLISLVLLMACHSKKSSSGGDTGFSYEKFSTLFPSVKLPYQVSDADVKSMKDTTLIRSSEFEKMIPDSFKTKIFGTGKIKFVALAQLNISKKNSFYIVKAVTANKRTAWLISFSNGNFEAVFPLLILDDDESTTQISSIEKSGGINKMVSQKKPGGNTAEGRDVYQYIPESRRFALVLTNPLNSITKVINPIDTLPHKNKLSGDYVKDKKNFISVRDGRSATQILVFIHIEHGDCSGEIKGEMLMTSPTTAVYRQSGDLCAVTLHFSGSSVSVKEDGGCGSRRGLDCSFNNTFSRKKEAKTKSSKRKSSSK